MRSCRPGAFGVVWRLLTDSVAPTQWARPPLFGKLHCAFVIVEIDIPIWRCRHSAFDFGSQREDILEAIHVEPRIRSEPECWIRHEVIAAFADILWQLELVDQDGDGFRAVFRFERPAQRFHKSGDVLLESARVSGGP